MKKLSRKKRFLIPWIALPIIAIIGSFINFYTINFLVNMIMEKSSPNFILTIFTFLGGATIAFEFSIAFMYIIRMLMHPGVFKRMNKVYSFILIGFSSVGLLCTILSGVIKYGSLVKPYPFPGAHIIALIWHILIIAFAIVYLVYLKKFVPEDEEVRKSSASYVIRTAVYSLLYVFIFNRLGALLWAPIYSTYSMFGKLITFYLYLLMPAVILAHALLYQFNWYKMRKVVCLSITGVLLFVSIVLMMSIVLFEMYDQSYIAAISMAMPVERASTLPVESLLMGIIIPASLIVLFIEQSLNYSKLTSLAKIKEVIAKTQKNK